MALLPSATAGFDAQDRVYYIEHGFGTQSTQTFTLEDIDATAFTIISRIEEVDTPPGVKPLAGYSVPEGGEAWAFTDTDIVKSLVESDTKISLIIPSALGALTSDDPRRTGAPQTRPMPGNLKYYQMGVVFIYPGGDSEELLIQLRLRYSVVYQNDTGEGA